MAIPKSGPRGESSTHRDQCGLHIHVMSSTGTGQTSLAAFDAALYAVGIENFNLMFLSSVIPPHSQVARHERYMAPAHEFGHRLYVVRAETRSAEPGVVVAAGLGWLQWGDRRGVFVEHEMQGKGQSCAEIETTLQRQIMASLRDLARRRGIAFAAAEAQTQIVSASVGSRPTCALVVAVYQSEGWR